jgi:hypothetical protein
MSRKLIEDSKNILINEVQEKEVKMMKALSKDMQKVLKGYQKIVKTGDKTLSDKQYNYEYETILQARDTIIQMIGRLETKMITQQKMRGEEVELEEKLGYSGNYQQKSKYDGKEFNKTKELKTVYKIQNALVKLDKIHSDLQYPNTVDAVNGIWKPINDAYLGCLKYAEEIKKGSYDGEIDIDS